MNHASKKMNPTRACKHQFSLASCLQSRRFFWSTGRSTRTKIKSREAVIGKKHARRQVQGEGKEFCLVICHKVEIPFFPSPEAASACSAVL